MSSVRFRNLRPNEVLVPLIRNARDVHGARRAGLLTGWASRLEGRFPQVFDRPDVSGRDLVEVVEGLMGLGDGASS